MRRFCILLSILAILNMGVSIADAQRWIPDTNLRTAVRETLDLADRARLTKAAMRDLTELSVSGSGVSDLKGLEFATNLIALKLNNNRVSDLSALSGLENLTHLYLWKNDITDVEPLRDLTQLELLRFTDNSVSDVSALEGLVNLRSLRLKNNRVSDVSALSGLANLEDLQLAGNQITNTGALADLVSNLVSPIDIVVFADRNLEVLVRETLSVGNNEMVMPARMAELTHLTDSGSSGRIKNLGGLEHATNLQELGFYNEAVNRDLTPLAGLAHLNRVRLTGTDVGLEALLTLPSLTWLHIVSNNDLTDMTIVSQLTSLERLELGFNRNHRDLTGLENLENLTHLRISGSHSASISEVGNLTAANALSDISPLSGLENLEYLALDYNGISDVSPLSALANLETLDLRHNNVSDVSPLVGLTGLTTLALVGNPVENAHVLYPLTQQDPPVDIDINVPADVAQDVDARPQVTKIRWPAAFVDLGDGLEYHTPPRDISDVLVQITFSEDVTDFESDDIRLLGTATTAAIESVTGSGSEYTLTISITPTTDGTGDGTLGIDIPAGVVQDVSGDNDNIAYSTGADAVALLFAPTLEIVVPEEPQNDSFDVVFEFNESVTGFKRNWVKNYFERGSVMNAIGGTLTGWNENATGTIYTATITPTVDGVFPVFRFAPVQVLAVNTDGLKVLDSVTSPRAVTVDLTPLKVTEIRWPAAFVDLGDGLEYHTPPRDISDVLVQITFSEDVTDFESDDIRLLGTATTAAIESVTGSGSEYTLTISITPTTDGTGDGTLGIDIPAGVVQDVSGDNDNIAYSTGADAVALLFAPTLEIVVPEEPQNGAFDVVFEFNESVTGFRRNWVDNYFGSVMNAIGGTLTGWNENATGTIYTATITPTVDGVFPVFRFAPVQVLAVNTDGLKVLDSVTSPRAVTVDLTPLKVTEIRWPAAFVDLGDGLEYHTPPRDISDVLVDIIFSEDVTDFESDDIRLLGTATTAAIESVTGSGSEYTLTISITPTTDGTGDGTLGIDIPAGVVQDVSGDNDNIAYSTGADAVALLFAPTLEIVVPEEPQNGAFDVVFEFNESVTGFRRNWVDNYFGSVMNAIGGILTGWNENATGTIYTATITPTVDGVFPIFRFAPVQVLAVNTDGLKVLDSVTSPRAVTVQVTMDTYLVAIPDEGLADALRDALELEASDGIPSTQLAELTTLDATDRQISDLTGLELATALTELDLRDNAISDVTPLAGLVKLETLWLTGNPIQDASSLSNLTAHIEADVVVPGVITDPALAVAIQETLGLPANTRILAETLENLVSLNVQVGEIDTLAGLEHATHLTTLRIDAGSITDVTPLQTLTQLTTLEINSDALTVITPLQTLTQLTTLKMNGGAITDVTPLQTLTVLTILELRDNTITDIASLAGLTALTTLDLSGNNISSIEALQELTGLTTLNLSGNSVSSIDRLQELTGLTTLNLSGNSISSIEALKVLTGLTTLNLSGNSISSIEALKVLTGLTTLEFADNSLSSIDGLQALTGLTTLNLSTNDLSDIQPLQGLTELKQLSLMSNNINDVLSLAGLVNLEFLRLAGNPIMDTSPLFGLVTTYKLTDVDIEISQWAPWDVNQDGIVNAMDAALVTAAIGQTAEMIANPLTDVNGDGVVDRNDLLLVQEHLNTDAAGAPSTDTIVALLGLDTLKSLSRTSLEAEMNALIAETDGSLKYQRAIKFLENFLLALRPNKTRLLANYPNPFNPETWIPYTLATVSAVQITIYDARGAVVRRLDLGHQREGYYTSRSRAAYWDGRNHVGERVASGIYFYQLAANDISLLRKMVILK